MRPECRALLCFGYFSDCHIAAPGAAVNTLDNHDWQSVLKLENKVQQIYRSEEKLKVKSF